MYKRIALIALFGVIALLGLLPGLILQQVDRYQVLSPQLVQYRPSIRCEGVVCPAESYDLLASGLYRVEERYRSLGDRVQQGEILALLAPVGRDPVLYLQTGGSGLGAEDDLAALAKSYGLEGMDLPSGAGGVLAIQGSGEEEPIPVTSPLDGVLTKEVPAPGSVVTPGGTVCAVEGRGEYFARLTVGEKDAAKLAVGNEVILTGEGVGLTACSGVLSKIYPGARKERSGTMVQNVVDIEVSIQPGSQEIRPGFTVKAQIFTADQREMLVLPYESVRQDQENQEYVMVAGSYRLEKRPIVTGQETSDGIEVLEGLAAGELVTVPEGSQAEGTRSRYLLEWEE